MVEHGVESLNHGVFALVCGAGTPRIKILAELGNRQNVRLLESNVVDSRVRSWASLVLLGVSNVESSVVLVLAEDHGWFKLGKNDLRNVSEDILTDLTEEKLDHTVELATSRGRLDADLELPQRLGTIEAHLDVVRANQGDVHTER